ncbi:MAG: hypothetical protein VCF24_00325 [Candidatus Latescibacterota bacterium]
MSEKRTTIALVLASLALALTTGCGRATDPVQRAARDLERYPEYTLIIEDLKVEDGFFPDYFLRMQIMTAAGQRTESGQDTLVYKTQMTEWQEVSEGVFARYQNYLGMVVASKTLDGKRSGPRNAYPAGYQYVGNSQYGSWGGGGFWQFYGQYAFMSAMLGGHRIGRNDYDGYRRDRERGRPHYGPVKNGRQTFGTAGTQTQKTRPGFYQRHRQRSAGGGRGFASNRSSSGGWGRGSSRFGK